MPWYDYFCDSGHPRWNISVPRPVKSRNRAPVCLVCGQRMKRIIAPVSFNATALKASREKK